MFTRISVANTPYPPPPVRDLAAAVPIWAESAKKTTRKVASISRRVRRRKGMSRGIPIDFIAQLHFTAAASGTSAQKKVVQVTHNPKNTSKKNTAVKRGNGRRSNTIYPRIVKMQDQGKRKTSEGL